LLKVRKWSRIWAEKAAAWSRHVGRNLDSLPAMAVELALVQREDNGLARTLGMLSGLPRALGTRVICGAPKRWLDCNEKHAAATPDLQWMQWLAFGTFGVLE
jgi:hypothetical protein